MADTILSTKVKSEHVQRAIEAINYGAGKTIDISIGDKLTGANFGFAFTYEGNGDPKAQAQRFLKAALIAFVRAYEFGKDRERFDAAVESITPPSQDVPDDMVE